MPASIEPAAISEPTRTVDGSDSAPERVSKRWGWGAWFVFALVLGVWAALALDATRFVATYGRDFPCYDEWWHVERLFGNQVTPQWLWGQSNEHRIPLPKFIWWALLRLTGSPYLPSMYFDVAALSGLALAFILVATRRRGVPRLTDALYPLLLLNWGHWENLIWGHQVQFVSSTCLAGIVFFRITAIRDSLTGRNAAFIVVCLMGLAMCGANGLAFVPILSLWLAATAIPRYGATATLSTRAVRLALASLPLIMVGLIYVGYQHPEQHDLPRDFRSVLLSTGQFLGMSGGAVGYAYPFASGIVVGVLLISTALLVARVWVCRSEERCRGLGFLACLLSLYGLALGVGYGRATTTQGLVYRYATLAVLAPCWVALLWDLYAPPRLARGLQAALLSIAVLIWWPNRLEGARFGQDRAGRWDMLLRRAKYKVPTPILAEMCRTAGATDPVVAARAIAMLRSVHFGAFEPVSESPNPSGPLPAHRLTVLNAQQDGNRFTGQPLLDFEFEEPRYVSSLHIEYRLSVKGGDGRAVMRVELENPEGRRSSQFETIADGKQRVLDITLQDVMRGFEIELQATSPCEFVLEQALLTADPP